MKKSPKNFKQLKNGEIFGRLTVISRTSPPEHITRSWTVYYLCKCQCGNEIATRADGLRKGTTQSCGCLQKEKARNSLCLNRKIVALENLLLNSVYLKYKQRAEQKNIPFELTKDEVKNFIFEKCFYCGTEKSNLYKKRYSSQTMGYNGIDRVDPKLGYEKNNCVTACSDCNYAKIDMELNYFYKWIKKTYLNLEKRNVFINC